MSGKEKYAIGGKTKHKSKFFIKYIRTYKICLNGPQFAHYFQKTVSKSLVSPSCPRFVSPYGNPPLIKKNHTSETLHLDSEYQNVINIPIIRLHSTFICSDCNFDFFKLVFLFLFWNFKLTITIYIEIRILSIDFNFTSSVKFIFRF